MATTLPASSPVVTLKGGLVVSEFALNLLWELEHRGFELTVDGPELVIRPAGRLTPTDSDGIRAHREELLALVTDCAGVVVA